MLQASDRPIGERRWLQFLLWDHLVGMKRLGMAVFQDYAVFAAKS